MRTGVRAMRIARRCARGLRAAGAAAAVLLLAAGAAFPAQEAGDTRAATPAPQVSDARAAELDARAAEIGNRLRCPICRQQSVTESSSELAREMQAVIREKLAQGETAEEIEAYFVRSYGEWILLQPPARGLNLFVYLLPAAAFLFGGLWLLARLRRRRASEPAPAGSGAPAGAGSEGGDAPVASALDDAAEPGDLPALDEDDRAWLDSAIRRGA